jgi:hypothetical protein
MYKNNKIYHALLTTNSPNWQYNYIWNYFKSNLSKRMNNSSFYNETSEIQIHTERTQASFFLLFHPFRHKIGRSMRCLDFIVKLIEELKFLEEACFEQWIESNAYFLVISNSPATQLEGSLKELISISIEKRKKKKLDKKLYGYKHYVING